MSKLCVQVSSLLLLQAMLELRLTPVDKVCLNWEITSGEFILDLLQMWEALQELFDLDLALHQRVSDFPQTKKKKEEEEESFHIFDQSYRGRGDCGKM